MTQKLMSRAVIKTRALKPLPGEITPAATNTAILPIRIEAIRKAVANCTELPEWKQYQKQADALAAMIRTIKEVGPEMVRKANELVADAWRKGGELLEQYSGAQKVTNAGKGLGFRVELSPRRQVAKSLGLSKAETSALTRIARATEEQVYRAVTKSQGLGKVAMLVPSTRIRRGGRLAYTDAMKAVMGTETTRGLSVIHWTLTTMSLAPFKDLCPNERKIVKTKIVEMQEILDEMDRLCR